MSPTASGSSPSSRASCALSGARRRQSTHSRRTRRCAITASRLEDNRNGSTPISLRRVTAPIAVLVCSVESTRWPVRDACTAICAVSRSRISPTITTSGSWRKIARKPRAKLISTLPLTCVWPIPGSMYSTGSSMVRILRALSLISDRPAYRVVVLPEPVGPVTRIMPWGLRRPWRNPRSTAGGIASCARRSCPDCLSSKRSTTRSPWAEGIVDMRISTAWPAIRTEMRPSWGTRRSAISRRAMTLSRDTSSGPSMRLRDSTSASSPSMR